MRSEALERILESSRKLNSQTESVVDDVLRIGARRAPYRASMPAVHGRGIGAGGNGGSCAGPTVPVGTPVYGRCPEEYLCDCDLIGVTTADNDANGGGPGILPGATALLTVTDFDAVALQPVAVWFTAFVRADNQLIADPVIELPCQVDDVTIGGSSQLRTRGQANGLNSGAFAATREPVCVDWAPFRSQNGQELNLLFRNIVNQAAPDAIHVWALLWCNILQ